MQQLSPESHTLLTARQVQQLLHIDRSTVYRMASDGRLPSIRVGRQLRFPADRLDGFLEPQAAADHVETALAEAVLEVAADLLGVTMVVTDMSGRPTTPIVNPSPWFVANAQQDALADCLREWRAMAEDPDLAPRFIRAEPGFECARAFIRSGRTLIGMVLAGGIAAEGIAAEGIAADGAELGDAFHRLDRPQREAVLRALPRIAAAIGPRIPDSARLPGAEHSTLLLKETP